MPPMLNKCNLMSLPNNLQVRKELVHLNDIVIIFNTVNWCVKMLLALVQVNYCKRLKIIYLFVRTER